MDSENDEQKMYVGRSLRLFLSYSSEDKFLAGALKKRLEFYGFEVFLAHEDIRPTLEWETEILNSLKHSDIFLPLLTENFKTSSWTDQETGIAISGDKMIIPLKVDVDPYGFVSRFQALKLRYKEYSGPNDEVTYDVSECCEEILKLIDQKDEYSENVKDCLIRALSLSSSYDTSNKLTEILKSYDLFSDDQVLGLVRAGVKNGQVYQSFDARPFLVDLVRKHRSIVSDEDAAELLLEESAHEG